MELSKSDKDKVLADCYADPVLFCQTFLYDHFSRPMPWVHRGVLAVLTGKTKFLLKYGDLSKITRNFVHQYDEETTRSVFHVIRDGRELSKDDIELLDNQSDPLMQGSVQIPEGVEIKLDLGPFTLIMMPRGSSKTTIAGLAVPLYKLLYLEDKFCLYVSKADRHSQGQLESVRKELVNNEAIVEFFGDIKPKRSDEERWSKEKFETVTGVAMQARGKGSAIRGVNHNNVRPTTILVDDPQSRDDCRSDIMREEDKRWTFAELIPARERISKKARIIVLGTWLHTECIVAVLSRDPKFTTIKFGVMDSDGDYIWPDYFNEKDFESEKASYSRAGLLGEFYREYLNEEVVEEEQIFPSHFIQYDPSPPKEEMAIGTYADLATSDKRWADYTCITTVGQATNGLVHVLECWVKRGAHEDEKIEEYFRQSTTWGSQIHGFESNAYQAVFGPQLRAEMFRRGHYFEVEPITHKTRKVDRIRGALRPRYASGFMRHRIPFPELESQLYDFRADGSHLHDDAPDAVAACLVLLDPAAAYNAGEDPTKDSDSDVEDLVGGDFRWAS